MNNRAPTEAKIWAGIIDADRQRMSVSEANAVLHWSFGADARRRMEKLASRNSLGELTESEFDELEAFVRVGQIVAVLQAKARWTLRCSDAE